MSQILGLNHVLANPERFATGFSSCNIRLQNLVFDVASAAIEAKASGANPSSVPGVLASLTTEDLASIQRRIEALESLNEDAISTSVLPYRRLMLAALRAKARYLLQLN